MNNNSNSINLRLSEKVKNWGDSFYSKSEHCEPIYQDDIITLTYTILIGAELGGAAGARAPPLFTPRPEIYSIKCA